MPDSTDSTNDSGDDLDDSDPGFSNVPDYDDDDDNEDHQLLNPEAIGTSAADLQDTTLENTETPRTTKEYVIAATAYSLCAATLLVINKASVDSIPSPAVVVASQLLFSALAVKVLVWTSKIEAEPLEMIKVKQFMGVSLLFTLCLVTNVRALQSTSVQTVIVMRACSPIFVALFDWLYLGTGMPHSTTWICLLGIAMGATVYCVFDNGFTLRSFLWPGVYFVSICAEMVFVKHIINTVNMSTWTRVYYNNALGFVPVLLFGFMFGEYKHINAKPITMTSLCVLLLACVVGLGISFAGFHARKLLSATSFTVLGVSNKFISIALSLIFISSAKTISWTSLFGLLMCIVCATLYAKTKSK